MEPEAFPRAEVGERVEVVGGARVDRAGRPDDADRPHADPPVGGDLLAQRGKLDAELLVHGNAPQRRVAHAEQLDRLLRPAVDLGRRVDDERRVGPVESVLTHVEPGLGVARNGEAREVGHRAAAHEQAARARREPHQLREPRDDLELDELRRLVEAREVCVHPGREHVGHHAQRRAVALDPAPEAGVAVAVRVREDVGPELGVGALGGLRGAGQGFVRKRRAHDGRHRLPRCALAERGEEVERVVDHPVGERAKLVPVGGVERLGGSVGGVGHAERVNRSSVKTLIRSLHHVTATVDDAQDDLDFLSGRSGLRLVKKTVNFDNHHVYHFYYGERSRHARHDLDDVSVQGTRRPRRHEGRGPGHRDVVLGADRIARRWRTRLAERGVAVTDARAALRRAGHSLRRSVGPDLRADRDRARCADAVGRRAASTPTDADSRPAQRDAASFATPTQTIELMTGCSITP